MIGLDTNILIRYFAQDDPEQSARATAIIEEQISENNPGFISSIVLVEMVWTLTRLYKMTTASIMPLVRELINAADLQLEHQEATWRAYQLVCSQEADFADALLGAIHHGHGCTYTLTFDKAAAKNNLFKAA